MNGTPAVARVWLALAVPLLLLAGPLVAQTPSDHVIIGKNVLMSGVIYSHDRWDNYWEGSRKRDNGNIGTLTTESITLFNDFGITDRLNLLVYVPYVWTEASQGVLHGMDDFQDVSAALKYRVAQKKTPQGTLNAIVVGTVGTPITNYTPDFLPLSIGLQSTTAGLRGTLNLVTPKGWFFTGSAAYTFRDSVKLDRPFYFTDGSAFLSDRVEMPDVADFMLSAGYQQPRLMVPIYLWHQDTLGGGDIRRQDIPFVSNNMDFTRIGTSAIYTLNKPKDLAVRVELSRVISGRNVGQSTTVSAGVFHIFHF